MAASSSATSPSTFDPVGVDLDHAALGHLRGHRIPATDDSAKYTYSRRENYNNDNDHNHDDDDDDDTQSTTMYGKLFSSTCVQSSSS